MVDNSSDDAADANGPSDCCKAGRVAGRYGLTDFLNETLAERWSAADGPGLRTLAEQFNKSVLETALAEGGDAPLDGEADVLYDQLTGDDSGRVERRLEKKDIDPNVLRDSFISYKTIDRHFKSCIDRERETADPMTDSDAIDRLRALNRRVEKVAAKTLDEVTDDADGFADPDVSASVTVVCSECGERKPFTAAVSEGCRCTEDEGERDAPDGTTAPSAVESDTDA